MKNKLLFILEGNNGATYIGNTKSWEAITYSLKFYKARTLKSKILKNGLQCLLFLKGILGSSQLKSPLEINKYLQDISRNYCDFNIDSNCSILISPTRDKVIVHHHHQYFQKFAFSKSYSKVINESAIYDLFYDGIRKFQFSNFYDFYDDTANFCSFKLSNEHIKETKQITNDIVPVLVEFFNITNTAKYSFDTYINTLLDKVENFEGEEMYFQVKVLETLKYEYGKLKFPLGLVHRDFKPWNILNFEKPLLFDFEEAVVDGPPLEDLLNFYIDPIIMYTDTKEVHKYIYEKWRVKSYKIYLEKLNVKIDFEIFLKIYIINRILFWKNENKTNASKRYFELLKYLDKSKKILI